MAKTPEPDPGTSPVSGKPLTQVEAESPPDEETAAVWQAEYESRMPPPPAWAGGDDKDKDEGKSSKS